MGDASWSPLYDLYATSEDGMPSKSVSLHYRVNLQQSTGEDWDNAKLILSTSSTDMLNAGVPASQGLVIEPKEELHLMSSRSAGAMRHRRVLNTARESEVEPIMVNRMITPLAYNPLMETAAIVSKNPMAVSYTVEEPTTIPSDHLSHKVLVAIIPFEATISHITSPRKSPIAYLQVGVHLSVQLGIEYRVHLP